MLIDFLSKPNRRDVYNLVFNRVYSVVVSKRRRLVGYWVWLAVGRGVTIFGFGHPPINYRCSTRKDTTPPFQQSTFFFNGKKSSYRHRFHRLQRYQNFFQEQGNLWPLVDVQ